MTRKEQKFGQKFERNERAGDNGRGWLGARITTQFAEGVQAEYPEQMLAYNLSPSFNCAVHISPLLEEERPN